MYNVYDVLACHELYFKMEEIFDKKFVEVEERYLNIFRKPLTRDFIKRCKNC